MVFCPGEEDYYRFKQFLSICFLILMCLLIRFWVLCLELFRKGDGMPQYAWKSEDNQQELISGQS